MKHQFPLKNVQQEKRIFRSRVFFAIALVLFSLLILIARYAYLQIVHYEELSTASDKNRIRLQPIPPARGYIYDRNGILLADNFPVFTATLSKSDILELDDIDEMITRLTPILHLTEDDIQRFKSRIKTAKKTERVTLKLNLNEIDIAKFSEVKFQFPGVNIETQMTRYYPHGELFAHVIGYVGRINDKELKSIDKEAYAGTNLIGKIGVEKSYEDLLHGVPGYESIEADAHGNVLRHLGRKESTRGNDLYLSLDYGLQQVAAEQLKDKRGAIVAIDPRTGELLALVSSPSFNPNLFVTGIGHEDYSALRDNLDQPLYNRALQGSYPPGSTIKPMAALAGIHYGTTDWNTSISDPGYFHLPGDSHKFRDWKKTGHGVVNMHKSIVVSCDTYFYVQAYQLGIERLNTWMRQFGFGEQTGVDLPNESSGLYPNPEWKMRTRKAKWLKGETISVSIGQGAFIATPLQLAMATAITANHGAHVTPHVLRATRGAKPHEIINAPTGRIQFNGTDDDWVKMRNAMVDVIESGTGRRIKTSNYLIAGKTGTAQVKSIAQGKRYNEALLTNRQLDHGLFVGFAPADNPEIAIAVVWENGRHGGSAAGLARPVLDYWIMQRKKNPLLPANHQITGGLMTAGIKPEDVQANFASGTAAAAKAKPTVQPTVQPENDETISE
ncbi:penicillin-binding protein 2 [Acinetobacter rudis]|uniref:Peptidoglycan D,D-transpeptidase MrdA n=1 Tax=Acinetobacter rudis CIP 110305 TaxID=421052 RepID=S3NJU6_9GAMM|nr:penicillin-binding protein 2 [Acinetobacter rudis CIP 110305]